MKTRIITGLMLIVAIIHLLPLSGLFGSDQLAALYGIDIADRNMEILMRHRAVSFGLLGGFFAYSAFKPSLQPIAFVMASISIASFLLLAFSVAEFNAEVRRVVIADIVAAAALIIAIVLYRAKQSSPPAQSPE